MTNSLMNAIELGLHIWLRGEIIENPPAKKEEKAKGSEEKKDVVEAKEKQRKITPASFEAVDHFDRRMICIAARYLEEAEKGSHNYPPAQIDEASVRRFAYHRWTVHRDWIEFKTKVINFIILIAEKILCRKILISNGMVFDNTQAIRRVWRKVIDEQFEKYKEHMAHTHLEGCKSLSEARVIFFPERHLEYEWEVFTFLFMDKVAKERGMPLFLLEGLQAGTEAPKDLWFNKLRNYLSLTSGIEYAGWDSNALKKEADDNNTIFSEGKRYDALVTGRTTHMTEVVRKALDSAKDRPIFVQAGMDHVFDPVKSMSYGYSPESIDPIVKEALRGIPYAIISPKRRSDYGLDNYLKSKALRNSS